MAAQSAEVHRAAIQPAGLRQAAWPVLLALLLFCLAENALSFSHYAHAALHTHYIETYASYPAVLLNLEKFPLPIAALVLTLVSLGYLAFRLWRSRSSAAPGSLFLRGRLSRQQEYTLFFSVLALAIFIRFWKLDSLVAGLFYDEGYKGLDGISIRVFGERPLFLDWNGGREALYAYLVAFAQPVFGCTIDSVRAFSAVAGCLGLVFFYLFLRAVSDRRTALVSTALLAFSKLAVIHSRYGVRASLYMTFELGSLYCLARGVRSQKNQSWWFLAAGLVTGLGLNTYIAFRVFPLVGLAFLLTTPAIAGVVRKHWKTMVGGLLLCCLFAVPLLVGYLHNPGEFEFRMHTLAAWDQKADISAPLEMAHSALATFGMFTWAGDIVTRSNVYMEPALSPFVAPFFLIGLLVLLFRVRRRPSQFILVYLLLTLLPGALSIGAPNSSRTVAALPAAAWISAIGIFSAFALVPRLPAPAARLLLIALLTGNAVFVVNDSVVRYPQILDSLPPRIADVWGMQPDMTSAAAVAGELGTRSRVYLSPQFFFHSSVQYLLYARKRNDLMASDTRLDKTTLADNIAVVFVRTRPAFVWWVHESPGWSFFKWWRDCYDFPESAVEYEIRHAYDDKIRGLSDGEVLAKLQKQYSSGRLVHLGSFECYIYKPGTRPGQAGARPGSKY